MILVKDSDLETLGFIDQISLNICSNESLTLKSFCDWIENFSFSLFILGCGF